MTALSSTTAAMTTGVSHSPGHHEADRGRDRQDHDHRIGELAQEGLPAWFPRGFDEPVRAVAPDPARRVGTREPDADIDVEGLRCIRGGHGVPRRDSRDSGHEAVHRSRRSWR
jgi:hypothetical protein